jgi:hypothetical protein
VGVGFVVVGVGVVVVVVVVVVVGVAVVGVAVVGERVVVVWAAVIFGVGVGARVFIFGSSEIASASDNAEVASSAIMTPLPYAEVELSLGFSAVATNATAATPRMARHAVTNIILRLRRR